MVSNLPSDGIGSRFRKYYVRHLQSASNQSGCSVSGSQRHRRRGLHIITTHGKHIHVVHDCNYSGGSCRCALTERLQNYPGQVHIEENTAWLEAEDQFYAQKSEYEATISGSGPIRLRRRGIVRLGFGNSTSTSKTASCRSADGDRGDGALRKYSRRHMLSSGLSPSYFQNLSEYLYGKGRRVAYYEVAGRNWVFDHQV